MSFLFMEGCKYRLILEIIWGVSEGFEFGSFYLFVFFIVFIKYLWCFRRFFRYSWDEIEFLLVGGLYFGGFEF